MASLIHSISVSTLGSDTIELHLKNAAHGHSQIPNPVVKDLRRRPDVIDVAPHLLHPDAGCRESPLCINCPLPKCKHDDAWGYQEHRRALRDKTLRRSVAHLPKHAASGKPNLAAAARRNGVDVGIISNAQKRVNKAWA